MHLCATIHPCKLVKLAPKSTYFPARIKKSSAVWHQTAECEQANLQHGGGVAKYPETLKYYEMILLPARRTTHSLREPQAEKLLGRSQLLSRSVEYACTWPFSCVPSFEWLSVYSNMETVTTET